MAFKKKLFLHLTASATILSLVAEYVFSEQAKPVPIQKPSSLEDIKATLLCGVPGDKPYVC